MILKLKRKLENVVRSGKMTRESKSKALLTINLNVQHVNGMTHCVKGVKGANIIYSCKVSSQLFTSWARFYGVAKGEHLQADDVVEIKVQQYSSFATTTVLIRILPCSS